MPDGNIGLPRTTGLCISCWTAPTCSCSDKASGAQKHGRARRQWRKLHFAVDAGTGEIAVHVLTEGHVDDTAQAPGLLGQVEGSVATVTADGAYDYGSLLATFAQGIVLGAFIQGFAVSGREFVGGSFDCFTPFSLLTGVALIFGYGLLGAGWLIMKTSGELQARARLQGRVCLIGVLACVVSVSVWTPIQHPDIAQRWLSWPNIAWLAPIPAITAGVAFLIWRALGAKSEPGPFIGAAGLFLMSYLGIAISLWPMIVPHHYTL